MKSKMDQLQRFESHGLNSNPFRSLTRDELAESYTMLPSRTEIDLRAIAQTTSSLVEISAPEGWGKTTMLLALLDLFKQDGLSARYHYLPRGRGDLFPDFQSLDVFLIDEAQRLVRRERRAVRRWMREGQGRMITGTHRYWRTAGVGVLRYSIPALRREDVQGFFRRRLQLAGGKHAIGLSDEAAIWLGKSGKNLRTIERWLYEVFQHWPDDPNSKETRELDLETIRRFLK